MILLVDNYDSFVYNLARYFEELGRETHVVRNDQISLDDISRDPPDAIVLSPGPCDPEKAGMSLEIVRTFGPRIPTLGVCLGHQTIAAAYGARIVRGKPRHGRTSQIYHTAKAVFAGLPSPFKAARYHSLVVDPESLPNQLRVNGRTKAGTIMAIEHSEYPIVGIQFHPESILTEHGHRLLDNFLHLAPAARSKSA